MGYEDFFNVDVGVSEADLDKLDADFRKAEQRIAKATKEKQKLIKEIDKIQNKVETQHQKRQQWFYNFMYKIENKQRREREKLERRQVKQREKEERKKQKEIERQERKYARLRKQIQNKWIRTGFGENLDDRTGFQKLFAGAISVSPTKALGFFHSPLRTLQSLLHLVPILGGVLAAKEIAEFIWRELVRLDKFFKEFIDRAETRRNELRDRFLDAQIAAGLSQHIVTTRSGSIDPRDAYNTYEEYHTDRMALENRFKVRDVSGV